MERGNRNWCAMTDGRADRRTHEARAAPALGAVSRRLVYALALIPLVPGLAYVGIEFASATSGVGVDDSLRCNAFVQSLLWVGLMIAVWRPLIVWTLGRAWLTALISLIPFVQVVLWLPLWDASGCAEKEVLKVGQHAAGTGLWVWVAVWVWWGGEQLAQRAGGAGERSYVVMSDTSKRVIASLGSLPVVVGLFLIVTVAVQDVVGLSRSANAAIAIAVTSLLAAGLWVVIWRHAVAWSRRAALSTLGYTSILILLLSLAWFFAEAGNAPPLVGSICWASPLIAWGGWMGTTVRLWPMKVATETCGGDLPRCLRCGYLLTGLCATRCPECGDERTIDELWRATAVRPS